MRPGIFFVVVLFLAVPALRAESAQPTAASDSKMALLKQPVQGFEISKFRLHRGDDNGSPLASSLPGQDMAMDSDSVCLTLRTYKAEREAQDSDVTHIVGSSTCQPSSKYKLKTAVVGVR